MSLLRAVPSVPTLAMRRAVLDQKLFAQPPSHAALLSQALAERARAGDTRARSTTLALASAVAHRRQAGDVVALDAIAEAAVDAGLGLAAHFSSATAAPKSLAPRGRLPEVGLTQDAFFPSVPKLFFVSGAGEPFDVYTPRPGELTSRGTAARPPRCALSGAPPAHTLDPPA
jgi:hypothetical protein